MAAGQHSIPRCGLCRLDVGTLIAAPAAVIFPIAPPPRRASNTSARRSGLAIATGELQPRQDEGVS
jgi:hypothetical protein